MDACFARLAALLDQIASTPSSTASPVKSSKRSAPRDADPFVIEARRKLDAMSADLSSLEKRHREALARAERERVQLGLRVEELSDVGTHSEERIQDLIAVEKRYETLKRHLDGSLTWRLGAGIRTVLRSWRKLMRPAGKGA